MFKGKISIIGAGFVGSTTAYTMMLSSLLSEIVLIDVNEEKSQGEVMDMNHGISFVSPVKIIAGGYSDAKNSDIVVITAGTNQKQGETRIDLLKRNAKIFEGILDNVLKYCKEDTIIMVVTNPVDILTYVTQKIAGYPKNLIFGSGTVLDTARLKYLIGDYLKVDTRDVNTYIIGEHGDTEVATWSSTTIAGISLYDYVKMRKSDDLQNLETIKHELHCKTKNAAYEIIGKKGATFFAIALSVRRIIEAIIGNENSILTISSLFNGQYGIDDVCLSAPTLVNRKGVNKILEFPFDDKEMEAFKNSANTLKGLARDIGY